VNFFNGAAGSAFLNKRRKSRSSRKHRSVVSGDSSFSFPSSFSVMLACFVTPGVRRKINAIGNYNFSNFVMNPVQTNEYGYLRYGYVAISSAVRLLSSAAHTLPASLKKCVVFCVVSCAGGVSPSFGSIHRQNSSNVMYPGVLTFTSVIISLAVPSVILRPNFFITYIRLASDIV
jgi:hypothetical protein